MSTNLHELVRRELLARWEPDLGYRRKPFRSLFVTNGFQKWAGKLPSTIVVGRRLVSPAAELEEVAARFVAGMPVVTTMTRIDPPTGEGIVRLKTSSFGLLGWCHAPQTLVLAVGDDCDATHKYGALKTLGQKAVRERSRLGLDWYRGEFYVLFQAQC